MECLCWSLGIVNAVAPSALSLTHHKLNASLSLSLQAGVNATR